MELIWDFVSLSSSWKVESDNVLFSATFFLNSPSRWALRGNRMLEVEEERYTCTGRLLSQLPAWRASFSQLSLPSPVPLSPGPSSLLQGAFEYFYLRDCPLRQSVELGGIGVDGASMFKAKLLSYQLIGLPLEGNSAVLVEELPQSKGR